MLSAQHGLDEVAKAFADRIAELQELTLLRTDSKLGHVILYKSGYPSALRSDHSLDAAVQMLLWTSTLKT